MIRLHNALGRLEAGETPDLAPSLTLPCFPGKESTSCPGPPDAPGRSDAGIEPTARAVRWAGISIALDEFRKPRLGRVSLALEGVTRIAGRRFDNCPRTVKADESVVDMRRRRGTATRETIAVGANASIRIQGRRGPCAVDARTNRRLRPRASLPSVFA